MFRIEIVIKSDQAALRFACATIVCYARFTIWRHVSCLLAAKDTKCAVFQ